MLQTIDGLKVYIVDFDTMPELPITWSTPEEQPYALALEAAIQDGTITEPGKYGIHLVPRPFDRYDYNVYAIKE